MTQHRCGWVALMGPPNAGKSTLTNSLVGQKVAIVTAKPQTTRNRIVGIVTHPDAQIILMDTPGIHAMRGQTKGHLGKIMLQSAWHSFTSAEVIVLVLDADLYIRKPDYLERDLVPLTEALVNETRPLVIVINKVDLFHDKSKMLPLLEDLALRFPKAEVFPLSALRRDGVPELATLLKKYLPEAPAQFPADQLSTLPVRFMAAEIIREKLFSKLYQEVPYAIAVDIENWDEAPETDQIVIHAAIYVTRPTHKAMVIGKAGATIKEIGTAARKEIRDLLDKKVHLELWVKVRAQWLEDAQFLHTLGFGAENDMTYSAIIEDV